MVSGAEAIEHGSTTSGRWLRARRVRIVLWLAALEGIVVAVALYVAAGRNTRWDLGHQVSWILAASQSLAVVVVILAAMVFWTALLLVGVFAAIALVILFTDR